MKTIILEPNERKTLARAGDTGVKVQMDALEWYTAYQAGTPELMVTAPGGTRWPVTVTYADGKIEGEVPDELMVRPGLYSYTFAWVSAGKQVRSSPCGAIVLTGEKQKRWDPHSKEPDWAERIFLAAEAIIGSFNGAMEASNTAADKATEAIEAAEGAAAEAVQELKSKICYATPEMFGAAGDGITDDTEAIQDTIDYCHENGYVLMGSGKTYAISNTIDLVTYETAEHPFTANWNGSTIKVISRPAGVEKFAAVRISTVDPNDTEHSYSGAAIDFPGQYPRHINSLIIDGNGLCDYGIDDVFARSMYFYEIKICNVRDTCFLCGSAQHGGGLFIDGMILDHRLSAIGSYAKVTGIDVGVTDAKIQNVKMRNIWKGVVLREGSTYLYNVHPYLAKLPDDSNVGENDPWYFADSIAFDVQAEDQHFLMCYADSYEIGWNIEKSNVFLTDCHAYWNTNNDLYPPAKAAIPELFHFSSASKANSLFITSFNVGTANYYAASGNKIKFSNLETEDMKSGHFYNLEQNMYCNWNYIDKWPKGTDYYLRTNLDWYYNGTALKTTDDLDDMKDVGRYYTTGTDALPINTPVVGANYSLLVEYVTNVGNGRRKQTVIDQNGNIYVRTYNPNLQSNNWSAWERNATKKYVDEYYRYGELVNSNNDLDEMYNIGRYYTASQVLPVNSPVSGVNYALYIDAVLDQNSQRKRQTIIDQYGTEYVRTCDTSKNWGVWIKTSYGQSGTQTITLTSGSTTKDVSITFPLQFGLAPKVQITPAPADDTDAEQYLDITFIVLNKSTTGFKVRAIMREALEDDFTARIDWTATA